MVSDSISCPLENHLEYFDDTSQLCRTCYDNVSHTKLATLAVIFSELFALDHFRCNFLNTLWNTIMILHSSVEQVMTMCCVQE